MGDDGGKEGEKTAKRARKRHMRKNKYRRREEGLKGKRLGYEDEEREIGMKKE